VTDVANAGLTGVGLTTAAARAVLAPAASANGLAGLVAQRLSEAIRLGLLLDGERLPPEARLAEQLGVSTVTLREALAVLRGEGLVTTRRGRGGGTFVSAPDPASGLGRRLREFSVAELRDLGDHRAAIAATAAVLAAERALPGEIAELDRQLDRLRAARTASDRRRAALQFSVGVAAAAQSPRLLREEQRLAAEVGDLPWMQASDEEHAAAVAARARLTAAVGRGDGGAAADIARQQVATETARMIGLRLRAYALDLAADQAGGLSEVGASLDRLFGMLYGLGAELAGLVPAAGGTGAPRRDDLAALRPTILEVLATHRGLAAGAGVITAPDVLADAPLWLEWWWTSPAGSPEQLRVNLDPAAPDFYDYTAAAWYANALRSGGPQATGPYVDYFCTGEYTITLSVPVRADGRFLGVAAADILVPSLEGQVMPGLLASAHPVALTSPDGRVIAATARDWAPGLRWPSGGTVRPSPLGDWKLAAAPQPPAGPQ
jgi:GntR family transcriptional repressor for pyruvate dehydrogenase complex